MESVEREKLSNLLIHPAPMGSHMEENSGQHLGNHQSH
jgi:hypothetical protein